MNGDLLRELSGLSAAEEFFTYFSIPFDAAVLGVNRLHILKRFHQYLRAAGPELGKLGQEGQREACRDLLIRAYGDFVRSTPAREKVFKVFQEAEGARVGLGGLRDSLPSRRAARGNP